MGPEFLGLITAVDAGEVGAVGDERGGGGGEGGGGSAEEGLEDDEEKQEEEEEEEEKGSEEGEGAGAKLQGEALVEEELAGGFRGEEMK